MRFYRALLALPLLMFWHLVAKTGGPHHPSYIHARWRIYQEHALLMSFVEHGE